MQFSYSFKEYNLGRCNVCTGIFYENDFFFDFKENFEHNRSLKNYIEKGSDIEELITVVNNFFDQYPGRVESGVDVGCGIGLVMDFSQRVRGKQMIGFEPSTHYSREGKSIMGLNIVEDYFNASELGGKKVDFAVCFQLLQLVSDPKALIAGIKSILTEDGIILLSTPDNEGINKSTDFSAHLSALSPGVHRSIFNIQSLQYLLTGAGFKYVTSVSKNGQLFAMASDGPLFECDLFIKNREIVLDYYIKKLEDLPGDSSTFRGIWYRLYRNRIDNGEYEEALELLKNADWFEMWNESEIASIETLDKLYELNSSADAIIYYYTGILFLNHLHKNEHAERFFLLSFLLCKKIIEIQPDMSSIERDIMWLAKLHEILVQVYQQKNKEANDEFVFMLSHTINNNQQLPSPSPEIIAKAQFLLKQTS